MQKCIATDKRGYLHNIFLISRQKRMLWVLIRSASLRITNAEALLMNTHNICFRREIRKISAFFGKTPYLLLWKCETLNDETLIITGGVE